jgi:hypothetical protein
MATTTVTETKTFWLPLPVGVPARIQASFAFNALTESTASFAVDHPEA